MAILLPLTTKLSDNIQRRTRNNRLEAQFGDGYKQVANNGINSIVDLWDISWVWVNQTDRDTIITALESSLTFTWTPYGESVSKTFLLVKDSVSISFLNTNFKISCQLERFF